MISDHDWHKQSYLIDKSPFSDDLMGILPAKFDWYGATVHEGVDNLIESACNAFEDLGFRLGKGVPQYPNNLEFLKHEGHPLFTINYGGHNPNPYVQARSAGSEMVSAWLKREYPQTHFPARIDTCVDICEKDFADRFFPMLERIGRDNKVKMRDFGFNFPENGRTLELGSRQSRVFIRCYEKGIEQGLAEYEPHRHWFRIEAEIKPKRLNDKGMVSSMSAQALWGSSKAAKDVYSLVTDMEPEMYKWSPITELSKEKQLHLLFHQRRKMLNAMGKERAIKALSEAFDNGFPASPMEFVSDDGEVQTHFPSTTDQH